MTYVTNKKLFYIMETKQLLHFDAPILHINGEVLEEGMTFFIPRVNELLEVEVIDLSYTSYLDSDIICNITMRDADNNEFVFGATRSGDLLNLNVIENNKYLTSFVYNSPDDYFANKPMTITTEICPVNLEQVPFESILSEGGRLKATAYRLENGFYVKYDLDANDLGYFGIVYFEEGDEIIGIFDNDFSEYYISPCECGNSIKSQVQVKYLKDREKRQYTHINCGNLEDILGCTDTLREKKPNDPKNYITIHINKNDSVADILETILDAIE